MLLMMCRIFPVTNISERDNLVVDTTLCRVFRNGGSKIYMNTVMYTNTVHNRHYVHTSYYYGTTILIPNTTHGRFKTNLPT